MSTNNAVKRLGTPRLFCSIGDSCSAVTPYVGVTGMAPFSDYKESLDRKMPIDFVLCCTISVASDVIPAAHIDSLLFCVPFDFKPLGSLLHMANIAVELWNIDESKSFGYASVLAAFIPFGNDMTNDAIRIAAEELHYDERL